MAKQSDVDWDAVEKDWRPGLKNKKQMSEEHGVSRAAMDKHFAKLGIDRDLTAKIQERAEAMVTQAQVAQEVTQKRLRVTEGEIVESNATVIRDVVLTQRKDVRFARGAVTSLFEELETMLGDSVADLKSLGAMMAAPDDKGIDKLNDLYHKVISLPGRTDVAKKLSESLRILIELERKVLRIKDEPEIGVTLVQKADPNLSRAEAYMRMIGKK